MAGKRGSGEGGIYFSATQQLWVAAISLGHDANGKRRRVKFYGASHKEVQVKLREAQNRAAVGAAVSPDKAPFGAFVDRVLEQVVKYEVKANTITSYQITARVHVKPGIGHITLAELRPHHIQALYGELREKGAGEKTIVNAHLVISRVLKVALAWGLIPVNPAAAVNPPRLKKREMKVWTQEQAMAVLAAAKSDRLEALYVLALTTGMREGEMFGLRPADVDLKRGLVHIQRQLLEISGVLTLEEGKTASARRVVDLPALAVTALRAHLARRLAEGSAAAELLFCDTEGKPLRRSNVARRSFQPLIKAAQVPPIRFHDLRHTHATIALAAGVHPKVLQERLGHSDIRVTLNTYGHVLPSMQAEAVSRLDDVFGGREAPNLGSMVAPVDGAKPVKG